MSTITGEGIEQIMDRLLEMIEEKRLRSLEGPSSEEPDDEPAL
jgi:nucleolar GTP-binding protein